MSVEQEKRRYRRYDHCAPITYCRFHTASHDTKEQHQGELLGHGAGGLRFKSAAAIRPGTTLLVKLDCSATASPEPDAWEGYRTITLAEVMWCQPVSEEDNSGHIVGAKYFNPYY